MNYVKMMLRGGPSAVPLFTQGGSFYRTLLSSTEDIYCGYSQFSVGLAGEHFHNAIMNGSRKS